MEKEGEANGAEALAVKSAFPYWRPLLIVLLVVAVGTLLRRTLGMEWSADGVRGLVSDAGAWAPITFVGLFVFRILLVIPSIILLPAGGLLFGVTLGSIYGTIGLTLSALINFGLVKWASPTNLQARLSSRMQGFLDIARGRSGAMAVAVISGYPIGPLSAAHFAAAVAGMRLATFFLAVSIGGAVRAVTYSFFGAALADADGILWSSLVMLIVVVVPLFIPRSREWLRASFGAARSPSEDTKESDQS